ncbi:hypothetical protein CLI64_02270 [Nostoc sp. CENA543]|uniref:hypothetical protein n=1 Tax=Nostoc sp. CENA543 TaxID=1869241 RepID=UPI000CA2D986|nr:hypothetical protein [Nostoc sp. CENA543]AUS99312.1 hypothetical protein CLI64_02270 [Nostoc sp. CENA543]
MKNKFLALAAFGAAALGGVIVSAPANAQIPQGSMTPQPITVNVSVPEILFLRTISEFNVDITPADLTGTTLTPIGTPPTAFVGSEQTTGSTLDTTSPFAGGFADGQAMTVTIPSAYIVWSNSPTGNYNVAITPPGAGLVGPGTAISVAVVGTSPVTLAAEGLVTATPQDIELELTATDPTAGTYTGDILVEAFRP